MKHLTKRRGRQIVESMSSVRLLVVGDVMLDRFLWGDVSRISPEAPVPVVKVEGETAAPGGAGNVIQNLAALGARVAAVGVVGDDPAGRELLALLAGSGIDCGGIKRVRGLPTTMKTRIIARGQQLLRADREINGYDQPREVENVLRRKVRERIGASQAVILSDYNKGTLTEGLVHFCQQAAAETGVPLAADPKPNHFLHYREGTTVIAPNRHELARFLGLGELRSEADIENAGRRLIRRLGFQAVLVTRGREGITLVERGKRSYSSPPAARDVYDVTGAGDTVIAWLTAALAAGATMREAAILANAAAGVVVGKVGTAPALPEEVLEIL